MELGVSAIVPSSVPQLVGPLPSTGSRWVGSPASLVLRGDRTSRRPSRFASFPSLRDTAHAEATRSPRFLADPRIRAVFFDPGGTAAPGHRALCPTHRRFGVAFRTYDDVGSHDSLLSRLNHTARILAVYASQPRSPLDHARLASGWWPSLAGRDFNPLGPIERFQLRHLHSPFPGLSWRTAGRVKGSERAKARAEPPAPAGGAKRP